jgi:hypothetical protein
MDEAADDKSGRFGGFGWTCNSGSIQQSLINYKSERCC